MNLIIGSLIVLEIIVSILLTLVILVQPSKGGGLGGALGGGMGEQLFGARTGNVLTKATVILATVFLMNTLGLAFLYSRQDPLRTSIPVGPEIEAVEGEMEGTDLPPVDMELSEAGTMEEVPGPDVTE